MNGALVLTILVAAVFVCVTRVACLTTRLDAFDNAHSEQSTHLAFVYGTLKTGERNHQQMFAKGENGSVFLGLARTVHKFPLIVYTPFNIPFLLHKEGTGHRIKGELYRINDDTLKHLDLFEGHPQWYERRQVQADLLTNSLGEIMSKPQRLQVWLYGLARFKKSLLDVPQLESYSEKDLEPDKRPKPYDPVKDGSLNHYLYDD